MAPEKVATVVVHGPLLSRGSDKSGWCWRGGWEVSKMSGNI